ncbi:PBP1A family penicillin-binding protein [bacterium]|nr:MAG: PBP1A family penicillin-binding protein [bacterium]
MRPWSWRKSTPRRTPAASSTGSFHALAKPARNRGWSLVLRGLLVLLLVLGGLAAGMVAAYSRRLPDITRMAEYQPQRATQIYARDGTLLANVYQKDRVWVSIDRIPAVVRDAFIATEDRDFYRHHGIDVRGIVRAALADYHHDAAVQGASTITQQLARLLFLNDQKTLARKVEEAMLAIQIERFYTKSEILERYLNLIYLGSGAYGVQAAAHTYFGTDVWNLSVGQAALLAGINAAPSDYSPYVNAKAARQRQAHVLQRMAADGYITRAQAAYWRSAPLNLAGERPAGILGWKAPYFTTYAVHRLEDLFGRTATYDGGLQVDTTLDPALQREALTDVQWGVGQAARESIGADEGALVAIRPSTGEILALVGGTGFNLRNQFNRAWQARRQPGSSFKLYVYTAAIDLGLPPTTIIDDSRICFPAGDGGNWCPNNDDHRFWGGMTLRYALAQSRNVVAVKLLQRVGVDRVIEYAHRMGIESPLGQDLSLALGTSVVSPLEQAAGYATIANQGVAITPYAIKEVKDSLGSDLYDNRYPQQREVVSAGTAYVVTTMLEDVIKHGTGYPNAGIGRPAAGKTGTTSDFRDAWFVGFTPDLVAAVWLGNDNNTPMHESYGGDVPARIWARFMKAALAKSPKHDFTFPTGEVQALRICNADHRRALPGEPGYLEYFLNGTEPLGYCYGRVPVDASEPTPEPATPEPSAEVTP